MIERLLNAGALLALFGWLFLFAACLWMLVGCGGGFGNVIDTKSRDLRFVTEVDSTESCPGVRMECTGLARETDETEHSGDVSPGENLNKALKAAPK